MIETILLWLIYFFIFYSYGLGVMWLIRRKEWPTGFTARLPQTILMGLVIVTAITLLISLILPMQIPVIKLQLSGTIS